MRDALIIAGRDALDMWRDGRFRWSTGLVLLLLVAALVTGWTTATATARLHDEAARTERRLSLEKGDMNPHAAAHYGAFVFKPIEPLSAVDPGLDPYVGVVAFLEAHHQQLARHRAVDDATPARRLGELSAAAVLQVLIPLLIVVLTHSAFAAEREAGTLRQLASLGVTRGALAWGKIAGASMPLAALLVPATVLGVAAMLTTTPATDQDALQRAALLVAAYATYFVTWTLLGLAVSAASPSAGQALGILVAVWFAGCFVAAPLTTAVASRLHPAPSAAGFTLAVEAARASLPAWDVRVAGVERRFLDGELVIDAALPSNPEVVALIETELDETRLYDRLFADLFARYDRQAELHAAAGLLLPALAVQTLSMGLAGTDYHLHRRFTGAIADYRRQFVQTLNAELAEYDQVDTFDYTRGRDLWEQIPAFAFDPPDAWWSLGVHRGSAASLIAWAAVAAAGLGVAVARMRVD